MTGYVLVSRADLETKLNQRLGHAHQRPGVWDDDNSPDKAGKPCAECAAETRLRATLTGGRTERWRVELEAAGELCHCGNPDNCRCDDEQVTS